MNRTAYTELGKVYFRFWYELPLPLCLCLPLQTVFTTAELGENEDDQKVPYGLGSEV